MSSLYNLFYQPKNKTRKIDEEKDKEIFDILRRVLFSAVPFLSFSNMHV